MQTLAFIHTTSLEGRQETCQTQWQKAIGRYPGLLHHTQRRWHPVPGIAFSSCASIGPTAARRAFEINKIQSAVSKTIATKLWSMERHQPFPIAWHTQCTHAAPPMRLIGQLVSDGEIRQRLSKLPALPIIPAAADWLTRPPSLARRRHWSAPPFLQPAAGTHLPADRDELAAPRPIPCHP